VVDCSALLRQSALEEEPVQRGQDVGLVGRGLTCTQLFAGLERTLRIPGRLVLADRPSTERESGGKAPPCRKFQLWEL
jgi:hypothetical protein